MTRTRTLLLIGLLALVAAATAAQPEWAARSPADRSAALTEGFQSAFLAIAILGGLGVAFSLLLLGRPRSIPQEQPELAPSPVPAGDR